MKKLMDPSERITRRRQRGAALILTVVVIMILTTVGMAMVTFTTTEERTATAYRDTLQVRSVAEAGVRMVQMMFNDPQERQLVPRFALTATAPVAGGLYDYNGTDEPTTETSLNAIGIFRSDRVGATPAKYTGATDRFFLGPFGESWSNVFGGAYTPPAVNIYDLRFTCTNPATNAAVPNCWLNTNINSLLQTSTDWNLDSGRITDISFYGAPSVNGIQYGITSVRVTAEKRVSGELLASETIEAVIGDTNTKPAVLGNGSIVVGNFIACGDGCEQVHANGNVTTNGSASGGEDPIITATGTVSGLTAPTAVVVPAPILTPEINPFDLAYKPKSAALLAKYYLVAARPLDQVWWDGVPGNNPAPRPCGINGLSLCQDYNLEYDTAGGVKPIRSLLTIPAMYKWNAGANEWALCSTGNTLSCPSTGGPTFTVVRADDFTGFSSAGDTADIPFNITRVPRTRFDIQTKQDGATVLVDGKFDKDGSMDAQMSIIAVGSIQLHSSTTWSPALENRVMWLAGRDVKLSSNCCAPSNTCATNLTNTAYAAVMAAHEQLEAGSQSALFGVVIAENRIYADNTVPGPNAINASSGDHGYSCGQPEWPWTLPTRAVIVSMKTATN